MSEFAQAEYERVKREYAPASARDLLIYAIGIAAMVGASLIRDVDWWFFGGLIAGVASWEHRKFRLRRNAQEFASGPAVRGTGPASPVPEQS